jgi:hypothetical protein
MLLRHSFRRHGLGTAAIGDLIHVAGDGAAMGGEIRSTLREAITLA